MSSRFPHVGGGDRRRDDAGDAALARDIVTLHKALSLDPSARRRRSLPLPSPSPAATEQQRHKPRLKPSFSSSSSRKLLPPTASSSASTSSSSSSSSSSFWKKSLTAISHLGRRRVDCAFALHVHSVDGLPAALDGSAVSVHFRRMSVSASTRPVAAALGAAAFEEALTLRSPVYFSRGAKAVVKYEPRAFAVSVAASTLDLGKHEVDLTRLLPLSFDDLEDGGDSGFGKWSTSFRLSGPARGARLNVTFSCSLLAGGGASEQHMGGEVAGLRRGSMARPVSVQAPTPLPARSRDVRVLHEVLPSLRSARPVPSSVADGVPDARKEELAAPDCTEEGSPEAKHCTSVEVKKGDSVHPDGDWGTVEFNVVEHGVEVASDDPQRLKHVETSNAAGQEEDSGFKIDEEGSFKPLQVSGDVAEDQTVGVKTEVVAVSDVAVQRENMEDKQDGIVKAASLPTAALEAEGQFGADAELEDLECILNELSVAEPEEFESPVVEDKHSRRLSCTGVTDSYMSASRKGRSRSMDASTDSVANEFLDMLGIEHSPVGQPSDSDSESPRERLWKQFEKEALASGNAILGLDFDDGIEGPICGNVVEDFDLSAMIHEAELELQNGSQPIDTKFRAKSLEDEETEALMRQFGLNEKSFQSSPPESRSGFGSPISLPPEQPLELPPLAEGLGPFIQTKDGGFLRSMNPALFKNAKNNCSLVMQASSPIVLPAEMGSGIMDVLHGLASVGIEKLSMQANKLMPLEDVNGKMMQQIAWEAAPALESAERYDALDYHGIDALVGGGGNAPSGKKTGRCADLSSLGGENASEYVSLEDLAPLAMEKIEALSIEGLRIQSGMSEEDAPSNISAKPIGEFSSLQGKCAENTWSLGLEGTAGLQLMDVKQSGEVDGLMGLSITLDEWMRLDSGVVDEEEQYSDRTSKILAAHHAKSMGLVAENRNGDRKSRRSGRWGLLGNNFTVALMVQLRDPLRNYEPVGTPMFALIQVERVFVPPKPKIYSTVSDKGNSEQDDEEPKAEEVPDKALVTEEKAEELEDPVPQFKVTEVHVAGFKSEPEKTKPWGNQTQQQSGSRWLLAAGMGKGNKHPLMKSKAVVKPTKEAAGQAGDTLWSISSRVHGAGTRWSELAGNKSHSRNPNIMLQKDKRFR
ncbi:Protein PLASTID MOVEMENT IMPAIRED 1-RELATED 1 [Zea mays]|uniref:Protein PLASTID MOVEMENT IMPAIRED 1-RELATED 1 n=2 Tax=Zea mays TaxID=4577 RepID=K7V4W4_MAIZE|nr:protein PLASTID MOVEMENT IMPAIRED 1-RELATED 1 [Zea mays]AQK97839.1 Protein PLASTID MOVEMENT IMPAIRED 1-RELATED 1 [Zea mays]PWZ10884.1 Protein PLASTID MOVEMENT IMPAIRED 1-RELATED 1 [Zea mays]|eukprot:XP_008656806.1 protein PLASTID MOVEMENT IMPAIRED 1-RELATED 1 [Zea mays]